MGEGDIAKVSFGDDDTGVIAEWLMSDDDLRRDRVILALCQLKAVAGDQKGIVLDNARASALIEWHEGCDRVIDKRIVMECLGYAYYAAMDRAFTKAGCTPLIADKGRALESHATEMTTIWSDLRNVSPLLRDRLIASFQMRDRASAALVEMRELRTEVERLRAELSSAGGGDLARGAMDGTAEHCDWSVLSTLIEMRRMVVTQRDSARTDLGIARADLRSANAEIDALRRELRTAMAKLSERDAEAEERRLIAQEEVKLRGENAWLCAFCDRVKRGSGRWPEEVKDGLAFLTLHGRYKYMDLAHLIKAPIFEQARRWRRECMLSLNLSEDGLNGSAESISSVCALIREAVDQFGSETLTLSADAMSTTQAVGVTPDGKVTGTVREVLLDPELAAELCADSAKFQRFVCEQKQDRNVVGALWAFVLTADGLGSPPIPIRVARSSSGKADDYILDLL